MRWALRSSPESPNGVSTVAWANHEVPLALGVKPVGFAAANFGDDDGDGLLPWVEERLAEMKAGTPVLFDEGDGIDFEAVAATEPDVILAFAGPAFPPEFYEAGFRTPGQPFRSRAGGASFQCHRNG